MDIYLLGTNHKTAEIEFRERIAFPPEKIPPALHELIEQEEITEAEILSTCNRTEIYAVCDEKPHIYEILSAFLARKSGMDFSDKQHLFYRMKGQQAVNHLFKVAAGLDSMVIGEPQILGQMKDAFRIASGEISTGIILNHLMNQSFRVGKFVRSNTALGEGAVSIAYAAVELAQKIFKNLEDQTALLIGAGDTGELTARHFSEKGIGKLYITNRTRSKAEKLGRELNGEVLDFSKFHEILPQTNIVVGTINAPAYILNREQIARYIPKKGSRPIFLIDIGVPRNFDPEINRLETVFLNDIDDLQKIVDQNITKRKQEIPRAEKIILDEIEKFQEWKNSLQITPTLIDLRKKIDEIRLLELDRHRTKLDESEFQKIDHITRALINKILHTPMVALKKYANGHPEGLRRVDVVREMFGLQRDDSK